MGGGGGDESAYGGNDGGNGGGGVFCGGCLSRGRDARCLGLTGVEEEEEEVAVL